MWCEGRERRLPPFVVQSPRSRYRVRFAGRSTNFVRARVTVDGQLLKVVRRRHVRSVRVRIRTAGTHTVGIVAKKRNGHPRRVKRRLAGCA